MIRLFFLVTVMFSTASAEMVESSYSTDKILWRLHLSGNKQFSEETLKSIIATQESSHWSWLWPLFGGKHYYSESKGRLDRKRIEHYYQRHGYFQAHAEQVKTETCIKENRLCAWWRIDEGELTRIKNIEIKIIGSNPPIEVKELKSLNSLKVNDVFNHDQYLQTKDSIEQELKEKGYPFAHVEGRVEYLKPSNQVDIQLSVHPERLAVIKKVVIQGLDQVLLEDVEPKLPIQKEIQFHPSLLENTQLFLARLDLFRSVQSRIEFEDSSSSSAVALYEVQEKPMKSLELAGGVQVDNSRQEAHLRAEWTHKNFFKELRKFNIHFEPRYAILPSIFQPDQTGFLGDIDLSLLQPAFFHPMQSIRTSIGFKSNLEQAYRWFGPQLNTNFERLLTKKLTVSGGYSFRYLTFYNVNVSEDLSIATRGIPPELLFRKSYRLGFINQRIVWDSRNNPFEPESGYLIQSQTEESTQILGSSFKYIKFTPELRGYLTMSPRWSLASRLTVGRIFSVDNMDSPITERYYGGGANNHRGFSYHRLSPLVGADEQGTVPIGGDVFGLFSFEPRIKLFRISQNWLMGSVFIDIGDVVASPSQFDLTNFHYAVGPGLRYSSPIGIIRADLGVRLNRLEPRSQGQPNPDPGKRFAIHVSIGEAF